MKLKYDETKWKPRQPQINSALQVFITNRCNKKCEACFYDERLGEGDMDFSYYKDLVDQHVGQIDKVILIGGEPTLHPRLLHMLLYNDHLGLKTTIYTNGTRLGPLIGIDENKVSIRIGVLGLYGTEKNLLGIAAGMPVIIVYTLRQDNIFQLPLVAEYAENEFDCRGLMISSIRDITTTRSFWTDTPKTISNHTFGDIVQRFVGDYQGNIPALHICRRGVLDGETHHSKCRYINVYPNGEKTICPLDIPLGIVDGEGYQLNTRDCQKHTECLLQKIVLEKVV